MPANVTLILFLASLVFVIVVGVALLVFVVHPREQRKLQAQRDAGPEQYAACPKCGSKEVTAVSWTWWGGAVGPKLFTHVKCASCGTAFNGKTGASNTIAILVYSVVAFAIAYGLFSLIFWVLVRR